MKTILNALGARRVRQLSAVTLLGAALLSGCSSVKLNGDVPVESRTPTSASTVGKGGAAGGGLGESHVESVDLTKGANGGSGDVGAGRIIYFDFDSYVIKDEYRPLVERQAKALVADRKKHVQLEGHTDERGGREYNLALGQKRAESVAKALTLLGATDAQLEAVSFGKERPAVQGSDEATWAKNRRVELNPR